MSIHSTNKINKEHKHYQRLVSAFANLSHSPEQRAGYYCDVYDANREELARLAKSDEIAERLLMKYESLFIDWVAAQSNCMSSFITGGANFPVQRAEKARNSAQKREDAIANFMGKVRERARIDAIPEEQKPVKSDDPNAIEKLQKKLIEAEKQHAENKAFNAIARKAYKEGFTTAREYMEHFEKHRFTLKRHHIDMIKEEDTYYLTNSNARIKALQGRIKQVQRNASRPDFETTIVGVVIKENKEAQRLQIFFEGKPTENVRNLLKRAAYKWAPSKQCWQRLNTDNARFSTNVLISHLKDEAATRALCEG